jgi:diacylglycerol kinase family enzyme
MIELKSIGQCCCCSEKKKIKEIKIEYLYLDLNICDRCIGTDDILEVTVVHTVSFPKLLCIFPFIFIGKHLWFKKQGVSVLKGRKFTLTASSPQPLQGDGEVIENVREIVAEIDEKNKELF